MVLSALVVFAIALEVFLFLGKDYLLNARRRNALEASLRQAYADLQAAQKRLEEGRAALIAAIEDADGQRSQMRDADRAFAESHKVMPTLIHTLGHPGSGLRFRAPMAKELPAAPEPSQEVIWGCTNVVEVWAETADAARALAARQFAPKRGYAAGALTEVESRAVLPPPQEAAA